MSLLSRVSKLEVRVFAHSTEDVDKVVKAALNVFPRDVGEVRFRRRVVSGQYGDSITILRAEVRGSKARKALRRLIQSLDKDDLNRLLSEVPLRVDEAGNLYVRLDKQEAYLGRLRLAESDPIRLKFSFKVGVDESVVEVVEEALEELCSERGGEG